MNILITGTSRGLGKSLAEIFLKDGHTVFGIARGESTINHKNYLHLTGDLTDTDKILNIIGNLTSVDVLINSAAKAKLNPFLISNEVDLEELLSVNVEGAYLLTREIAKLMVANNFGRIINVTTIGTKLNIKGEVQYLMSKAALEKMTDVLAKELFPFGITVNNVAISLMDTDLIKGLNQQQLKDVRSQLIDDHFVNKADLKHLFDFLIHENARSITGQKISFGGI